MRVATRLGAARLAFSAAAALVSCGAASADVASVMLHGQRYTVEIASTPAQHAHGLMGRTHMPADHGMLFVFDDVWLRTFWMKDTLIPLDMLFFDGAGRLVAIQRDAQPCKADPCPVYPSNAAARYVLELNAGAAAQLGLRLGEQITLPRLPAK